MGSWLPSVSILTPTRDRPVALEQCARMVGRQDYEGEFDWAICSLPGIDDPIESFTANLLNGITRLAVNEVVVIMEDDDWYAPNHISELVRRLEHCVIAGHVTQRYYHLPSARWMQTQNRGSALCQTGFRYEEVADLFAWACRRAYTKQSRGVDALLWTRVKRDPASFPYDNYDGPSTVVGMKGLPGTPGLGIGHAPDKHARYDWQHDPDGTKLREWVGMEDAEIYMGLL